MPSTFVVAYWQTSDRAFQQHERYLLQHFNPFDSQTLLKIDQFSQEQRVWCAVSCVLYSYSTDSSYSGWLLMCTCEKEKNTWEKKKGRSTDSTTIHMRVSKHPILGLFSKKIIGQGVHLCCVFLCRRKPNRFEEVCCCRLQVSLNQIHQLIDFKEGEKYTLTALGSSTTKSTPHWRRIGQSCRCYHRE